MIRTVFFQTPESPAKSISLTDIPEILKDPNGLLWVDLAHPDDAELHSVLEDIFHFHPLAIDDCHSKGFQVSKIDDFGNYIFLIVHAIQKATEFNEDTTLELNLFLGENFLVTCYHSDQMTPVEMTWKLLDRDERLVRNGSDFLCHAVLNHLVDEYMPLIDRMDTEIEDLEDLVMAKPTPDVLAHVLEQKHNVMFLRRIISPQREVVNRLSRDDFPMIDRQSRIYYRDIYDHLVRLQELAESLRDIVSGVLDIYLNSTSLRLNEIMKALTIVSTIFLPMSFLAGVYGMNFQYMPELTWKYGYLLVWVIFVVVFVGMLAAFKRRKWF